MLKEGSNVKGSEIRAQCSGIGNDESRIRCIFSPAKDASTYQNMRSISNEARKAIEIRGRKSGDASQMWYAWSSLGSLRPQKGSTAVGTRPRPAKPAGCTRTFLFPASDQVRRSTEMSQAFLTCSSAHSEDEEESCWFGWVTNCQGGESTISMPFLGRCLSHRRK